MNYQQLTKISCNGNVTQMKRLCNGVFQFHIQLQDRESS